MRPFLLEYRDENEVELIQEGPLRFQGLLRRGTLDDEVDDKVADAWT